MKKVIRKVSSLGVLLSIICLALAGCGSSSDDNGGTTPGPVTVVDCSTATVAATVTATSSNTFDSNNVTIPVNSVVRWFSASATVHTVTSGTQPNADGKFDQPLNPGSSVCLQFTEAGTFNYYCIYHNGMTGVIAVQ